MLRSLSIAFSTYSKIPAPRVEWNENSMRYSICFFPVVGAVIGGISYAIMYFFADRILNSVLWAAVLAAVPVLVTGGIHMDGFIDTVDAKSSYKDREEKLKILKDPHVGAFAIIFACVYFVLYFGMMTQITANTMYEDSNVIAVIAISYILVRILSGLSVVFFKKAKKDGMLAQTAKAADRICGFILILELVVVVGVMLAVDLMLGAASVITGAIVFIYYRLMSYKVFGGVTGDLAGYFLQLCELAILVVCAVLC